MNLKVIMRNLVKLQSESNHGVSDQFQLGLTRMMKELTLAELEAKGV